MSESLVNIRKRHIHYPKDRSKLTRIIHGPGHSSYECKVLGDFGSKYYKSSPTKDHGHEPTTKKKIQKERD